MTGKKYEFTDAYLTGIPSIDEEHARLFEIANEVYDLLEDELVTDKYDRIVEMIDELRAYTKTHFANEEAYMERIGFPHIRSERRAHRLFVKKLEEVDMGAIDNSQDAYILEVLDFLTKWLTAHIKGADRRIGLAEGTIRTETMPHDSQHGNG